MTDLPPPDPAVGNQANQDAGDVRQTVERQLADGTLTLRDLGEQIRDEEGHAAGHMNVRRALLALPDVDDVRADRILEETGLDGSKNLDALGANQWGQLIEAAALQQQAAHPVPPPGESTSQPDEGGSE